MFPGSRESIERDDAAYVVIGAPLDVSTSFLPGTRFGPDRIRQFARPFDDYDRRTDLHFSACDVIDEGDVRAWNDTTEYLEWLNGELTTITRDDALPVLLGGEHTISRAGVDAVTPDVFVCLDAHLDLRQTYDGNTDSHATVTHHITEMDTIEEVIIIGARAGSEAEWERATAPDVTIVSPADITAGFDVSTWIGDRSSYLSVDIDAVDPGFAPGTGTPEPGGITPQNAREIVRTAAGSAVGFDIVEVTDRDDGQTASLAGKLVRDFVYSHRAATIQRTDNET
ncbi:agmatinase [Haloquadratum walsbyi]|jgi:agmatinase (EC 3.5.3.11)|uniref:Agmatinase n=1 Tax=Haloquadratum walsbyi J07HQW2 TaxID=1238425 RepID=U1NEU4_9EURY|nr:agmatinase [Haloquadratum walsbyi]ERG95560.1 MAG: agmatinase [Haloquadratum walsbyi J07HQW2]